MGRNQGGGFGPPYRAPGRKGGVLGNAPSPDAHATGGQSNDGSSLSPTKMPTNPLPHHTVTVPPHSTVAMTSSLSLTETLLETILRSAFCVVRKLAAKDYVKLTSPWQICAGEPGTRPKRG